MIRENIDGLPALANAGKERFRGIRGRSAVVGFRGAPTWRQLRAPSCQIRRLRTARPDGSVQQLGGNRLELSPKDVASAVLSFAPSQGLQASGTVRFVGSRFLNKGNTVKAGSYATVDGRVGWKFKGRWGLFIEGENLTNRRDPVTESEIGEAQFYRLPGRRLWATLSYGY